MTDALTCQQLRQVLDARLADLASLNQQLSSAMDQYSAYDISNIPSTESWQQYIALGQLIESIAFRVREAQSAVLHAVQALGEARCS